MRWPECQKTTFEYVMTFRKRVSGMFYNAKLKFRKERRS
jgi:hypothetical protein